MSERTAWLRRLVCIALGHQPDGVVRGGDDWNGGGGEMWCVRRCGWSMRPSLFRGGKSGDTDG